MGEQYYQDLTHGDQYYYATVYPSAFGVFISLGMRGAVMYGIVRFGAIHCVTVSMLWFCVSQKGVMRYFGIVMYGMVKYL